MVARGLALGLAWLVVSCGSADDGASSELGSGGNGQGGLSATAGSGGGSGGFEGGSGGEASAGRAGSAAGGRGGALAGSGGSSTGGNPTGEAGAGSVLAADYLEFTAPSPGQAFTLDSQSLRVEVGFRVETGSGISSVEYITETGFSLGVASQGPDFAFSYPYRYTGSRWAEARGLDADGIPIAADIVNFVVDAAPLTPCLEELDILGVEYQRTTARGVVDAVQLTGPLNGVRFTITSSDNLTPDPMACEFVKRLWRFAELLQERGFNRVGTLGSYCYRCCCSWSTTNYCRSVDDPEPDCSANGYSNHSFGRAIDVRYLYTGGGVRYDVNDPTHWVEWPDRLQTCAEGLAAQASGSISEALYSLACEASARQIFGTILTPNYNSAHRNHWHADIGESGEPGAYVVRSLFPVVDWVEHGDY